jgi:tripartite-type tricarboxylate transporter receptor subunit TctC
VTRGVALRELERRLKRTLVEIPMRSSRFASLAVALVLAGAVFSALAQEFPAKPVRWIVPYSPGGSSDILARLIGQKLAEAWGRTIIVDNRPGAAGNIGTEAAARSAADGYTLLLVASTFAMNPSVYPKLAFDAVNDFAPVTMIMWQPFILSVHPSLPVKNVKELIALARQRPGELNFSSGGSGTSGHVAAALFAMMSNVRLTHVPYRSMGPAITALLTGEVQLSFNTSIAVLPHAKEGRLRPLGVTGSKRMAALPGVPTITEAGVPGYEEGAWQGVLVPAATPRALVTRLNQDLVRTIKSRETSERIVESGAYVVADTPEEFAAAIKADIQKYAKLVKAAGIRAD